MWLREFLNKSAGRMRSYISPAAYANFIRELSYVQDSDICWGPPKIWEIETTSHCTGMCIMCPKKYIFEREKGHMSLDLLKSIMQQIKPWYQVDYPGGEPTIRLCHYGEPCLYPHFYESIAICKERGFYVVISDIAGLFNADRMRDAIKAGLDEIWMMLDGMDEQTSVKIRGPAASFKKSMANICGLVKMKQDMGVSYPKIRVIMIRQPANAHQWNEFVEYGSSVEGAEFIPAHFSNFGGNVAEINQLLTELQATGGQPEEDNRVRNLNNYRCFYPWHSVSILSDGRVVPCCRDINGAYILGDLNHKSLGEIWNDEPIRGLRREFIMGRITNTLCSPCTEANNEIRLPCRYYPGFHIYNRFFPDRFKRRKR